MALIYTPVTFLALVILSALPGLDVREACSIWQVDKMDFLTQLLVLELSLVCYSGNHLHCKDHIEFNLATHWKTGKSTRYRHLLQCPTVSTHDKKAKLTDHSHCDSLFECFITAISLENGLEDGYFKKENSRQECGRRIPISHH